MFKDNSKDKQGRHHRRTVRDEMAWTPAFLTGPRTQECVLCEQSFAMDQPRSPLRPIRAWANVLICDICRGINWDGIPVGKYPKLEAHLVAHRIVVKPNTGGLMPIPNKHR